MAIVILLFLTILNGVFALTEIALVSVKNHAIEQLAQKGNKRAKIVFELLKKPESFLSSVQVGITLIGIFAGAYGATTLVPDVAPLFEMSSFLAPYSETLAFFLVVTLLTYFSIVIGELIPKSIALNDPEKMVLIFGPVINTFSYVTYPFVKLLSVSTRMILKLMNIRENANDNLTEDELVHLLKTASNQGVLEQEESEMHQNIFTFSEQRAKALRTHRLDVEWIDVNDDLETITKEIKNSQYSKFPVCDDEIDNVIGVVNAKDFFENMNSADFDIRSIMKEPIFVPEMMFAVDILRSFKKHKQYIGIVIDEFGSFEGVITLHDLIEAIVGDLPDEDDEEEGPEIFRRNDGSLLINGTTEIKDLNNFLDMELINENPENYVTFAGFVIYFLERIPETGEKFEYNGYEFEIVDLDGNRIDKIIAKKISE
jgi:putative hemolysin